MLRDLDARARALGDRVKAFMRDERADRFDGLALDVFAYQFERNEAYRRFCVSRSASPENVRSWRDVPAIPAETFKHASLACAPAALVFRTSGTSAEGRGEHHVVDPTIYETSLLAAFRRFVLPDRERMRVLSLVPPPSDVPDSSLGYMAATVLEECGLAGSGTHVGERRVLHGALFAALDRACAEGEPLLIFGTTLALVEFLSAARDAGITWPLPQGSRLVDTGGTKARDATFDEEMLLVAYRSVFGLPASHCVNEYGMTEMLSQLYNPDLRMVLEDPRHTTVDRRVKAGPHWLRSRVVDPVTLRDADAGILVHVDLANVHGVSAILTEDLGERHPGGIALLGRRLGAEARGCSIGMDEWLA